MNEPYYSAFGMGVLAALVTAFLLVIVYAAGHDMGDMRGRWLCANLPARKRTQPVLRRDGSEGRAMSLHYADGTLTPGGFVLFAGLACGLVTPTVGLLAYWLVRGAIDDPLADLPAAGPSGPVARDHERPHHRDVRALSADLQRPSVRSEAAPVHARCTTPVEDSPDAA